jgi:hypothetical protein
MAVVKSKFIMVNCFLLIMLAFLRQALMPKLALVKSVDQEAWMKAEDHVAGLSNNKQMLTFENIDQTITMYETYAARLIDTKTTICRLLAGRLRMTTPVK